MLESVRIGRSGYLLSVTTYIIDVNAHCLPFIKTPPYIRSTPLEDFIPALIVPGPSFRAPHDLSVLLHSPLLPLLLFLLLLLLLLLLFANPLYASISSFAGQVIRFCSGNEHHHLLTLSHRGPPLLLFLF